MYLVKYKYSMLGIGEDDVLFEYRERITSTEKEAREIFEALKKNKNASSVELFMQI